MAGYGLSLFVLVSLAPACINWPTKFWWGNEAHLLKLWTLVQRCVALRNEGTEPQAVNDLFAFDMVRNKSVSLLGLLNLDHFIWGFGGAMSIESWLLFFRAVSADMSVCPRSKAFLGGKITKAFHFSPTQIFRDDINSTLFYLSVIARGSVLYFMGNLVAGDILSSGFSICCWFMIEGQIYYGSPDNANYLSQNYGPTEWINVPEYTLSIRAS